MGKGTERETEDGKGTRRVALTVTSPAVGQMIGELAGRILRLARPVSTMGTQKRNSELINSLLGLPKIMNDAGR